jgi:hypothetical protein
MQRNRTKTRGIHNVVVLDISTFPANIEFRFGGDRDARRPYAPGLIAACVYATRGQQYRNYLPNQAELLLKQLETADELVTFNGLKYDLVVLEKHYGLSQDVAHRKSHTDLALIFEQRIGRWVDFNEVVQLNLGERKIPISEFPPDPVNRTNALAACKSDVRQTYKLWKLYKKGQLKFPVGPTNHAA